MTQWKEIKLGDHLSFITSGSRGWSEYYASDGALFLRIQNVGYNELRLEDVAFVQPPDGAEARRTRVQPGDVLLSITADLGRTAVVPEGLGTAHINQHLAILRVEDIDPHYLAAFLSLGPGRLQLQQLDRIGVKSGLNFDDVRSLRILLPPLPEQRRIAAILDKADAIRRKRAEALRFADDFLKSAFLDMFGDPVANTKGWPLVLMSHHGSITTGNTPSREKSEYYGDFIEWIKSDNINTPSHILSKASEGLSEKGFEIGRWVPAGSTLVTCIAGSPSCIGNAALADRQVAFNQQINAITPNKDTNYYFLYMMILLSKRVIQRASTNAMKGMVSKSQFAGVTTIAPPFKLQEEYSKLVKRQLSFIETLESAEANAQALVDSLTQRAFRGEL